LKLGIEISQAMVAKSRQNRALLNGRSSPSIAPIATRNSRCSRLRRREPAAILIIANVTIQKPPSKHLARFVEPM
jgi:hypothetical protein